MSVRVMGICSICGGQVVVPHVWHGIYPPKPECVACHAVAASPEKPVIPMRPRHWPGGIKLNQKEREL